MFYKTIKSIFYHSIQQVTSNISEYVMNPKKDMTRKKKLPADKLISFLVSQGASSTKIELLDFFNMDSSCPTVSALNQQRSKLKPEALQAVFNEFNSRMDSDGHKSGYRFLAADGSTFSFFSKSSFADDEYLVSEGHSAKGFYSMHLNALYDLEQHTYTDAVIQPVHKKNEFGAFCTMIDRHNLLPGIIYIFIGDRGYCSYNNMAHVMEKGQYFLFRAKDINSRGLVHGFDFPEEDSFDITVNVTLVRTHSKKKLPDINGYIRYIDEAGTFDFIEYGSNDIYELSFRIVRFKISDDKYECIVTNLPADEFPMERIKRTYSARWGIESSFRKLKYTIGLSNFHSYKPEYIMQEIWAKMTAYNITEIMINHTIIKQADKTRKHDYKVNFSTAAHICRIFLRLTAGKDPTDVMARLAKELIPVRNDRRYPRLQTAHFRRPRYFIYRAA